jgi:hypothetical protein
VRVVASVSGQITEPRRLRPPQLWGLCLEMVDVAGYSDPEYVRQLWDVHLKATVDAAGQPGLAASPNHMALT